MSVSLVQGDNVRFVDNLIVGRCEYGEKVVSLFETLTPSYYVDTIYRGDEHNILPCARRSNMALSPLYNTR